MLLKLLELPLIPDLVSLHHLLVNSLLVLGKTVPLAAGHGRDIAHLDVLGGALLLLPLELILLGLGHLLATKKDVGAQRFLWRPVHLLVPLEVLHSYVLLLVATRFFPALANTHLVLPNLLTVRLNRLLISWIAATYAIKSSVRRRAGVIA